MKKSCAYILSLSMLASILYVKMPNNNIAVAAEVCETVEECEAQKDKIKQEQGELEQEIANSEADKSDLTTQLTQTVSEILKTEESIKTLHELIRKLNARIDVLNDEITGIEDEILNRFAVQQKSGNDHSYLLLLVSSSSFTSLANKLHILEQFNTADQEVVIKLDEKKQSLVAAKQKNEDAKAESEAEKDRLEELRSEQKQKLAELQKIIKKKHAHYDSLKSTEAEINKQKAILQGGVPSADGWNLPAQRGWFTCGVGDYAGHIGADFGMTIGTPVYAAADGKVVFTDTGYTGFVPGSFGNVIGVSHNIKGVPYVTIYAHLSSVNVSPGDVVSGGETIGYSGETGEAYGPHLHIEVLKDLDTFYYDKSVRLAHYIDPLTVLPNPGGWQWSF